MVPAWIGIVAELLNRVAELIEKVWYAKRTQDRQNKADQAAVDPAAAFAEHFGGRMHNLPGDASKTDKAGD